MDMNECRDTVVFAEPGAKPPPGARVGLANDPRMIAAKDNRVAPIPAGPPRIPELRPLGLAHRPDVEDSST